ncbi:hypothetical protein ACOME3_002330 [Neoechinorhynchus agilis]
MVERTDAALLCYAAGLMFVEPMICLNLFDNCFTRSCAAVLNDPSVSLPKETKKDFDPCRCISSFRDPQQRLLLLWFSSEESYVAGCERVDERGVPEEAFVSPRYENTVTPSGLRPAKIARL